MTVEGMGSVTRNSGRDHPCPTRPVSRDKLRGSDRRARVVLTLKTIKAAFRGLYPDESLWITFLDGEVRLTGRVTGIGGRIGARTDMRLHEDIHVNRVLSMEVK
ncbi:hypothetical protein SEA_SUCCESS_85 [Streptomyces phage Success]|uniref:Uncharacterized protein n=1 Tax=Streptomyces phage Success TaxID=2999013 RepID=A0A9E8M5Y2_9CAUD|nr:hypothetical protein QEH47_gp47 [Streptomyces phage Success]WAB08864.1 hypothetical protein SEA_SUCCESS_85 [Streptomyces phage Success]